MKIIKYHNGIVLRTKNKRTVIINNKGNMHIEICRTLAKDEVLDSPTCRTTLHRNKVVTTELMISKEGATMLQAALTIYLQSYDAIHIKQIK